MKNIFAAILFSVIAAFITVQLTNKSHDAGAASVKENAYARVMRTKTLRCGWINYPPVSFKDPKTGQMQGIFVEAMEDVGKQIDVKIDWSHETTLANFQFHFIIPKSVHGSMTAIPNSIITLQPLMIRA